MNYRLDKKNKNKRFINVSVIVLCFLILIYFRSGIFAGLAYAGNIIFYPVLAVGNKLGEKFSDISLFFASKSSLYKENEVLKSQLDEDGRKMANYSSILEQNLDLKEILGRKEEKAVMTLAAIIGGMNQSLYDTLVVDAGGNEKVRDGDIVFAIGNIPIGRIFTAYPDSSKVVLFSNPGEKTRVIVSGKNISMDVIGRGGGNFEMILPRDFTPVQGDQVVLPGITPYVLAIVETIISDPRDPFVKALLVSPVNVRELKFVQVASQN